VELRVNGVYHSSIINHLSAVGLTHYSFDLRPKSFNFTQAYKIKEILSQTSSSLKYFYLHFEEEKDFIIKEIFADINEARGQSSLWLEFSGKDSLDYYDSFEIPYLWHYHENISLSDIAKSKNLKKISFDQLYIERLLQFGQLYDFFGQLIEIITPMGVQLEITASWDSPLLETILDFYPITSLNYEISSQVEKSYRQIDLQLMTGHIEHTKRSLNI
jgi:hypothetical protein